MQQTSQEIECPRRETKHPTSDPTSIQALVMELLLGNSDDEPHTFSHQQDMLLQPSIWIGDTGATVHMTPHSEGMIRLKNTKCGITVGNGEVIVAKKTGDIPCEICDKYGNTVTTGIALM
jgi:hypothetical protein